MVRPILPVLAACALSAAGCFDTEDKTALVPDNPFGQTVVAATPTHVSYAQPQLETAARVDQVGKKLVGANPQMGSRPAFHTLGVPQSEVFHKATTEVFITEGLAKQCTTEAQLAAVLAHELGKMVSEREALASPQSRAPEGMPPPDLHVGDGFGGSFGPADQLHRAELAKYEKEHPRKTGPLPPPNPDALARTYLTKAGYAATELDGVSALLRAAADNTTFAKQILVPAGTPTDVQR
jgi:predicted Zn-dependent protease